ncbi:SGF29 tudor-like domain-containing protein [Entophlyctis helioformis]|nr:SGF29 tudor-like domain-containing protein [Entophlyctis helioformis]
MSAMTPTSSTSSASATAATATAATTATSATGGSSSLTAGSMLPTVVGAGGPPTEESSLWTQAVHDLSLLHALRIQNDSSLARMNKVHSKIAERQESKDGFTVRAAVKLGLIYKDAVDKAEQELRVMQRVQERLGILHALREAAESGVETKRKKRKTEAKGTPSTKRARMSDAGSDAHSLLQPGDQVVARVQDEWILANVTAFFPEKGKYEVEDAEDEDGERKRFLLPTKMLLPIPKETERRREFPVKQKVLALFPTTTCFYQATVVMAPSGTRMPQYVVIFDDDNNFERQVEAHLVLECPK